MFVATSQASGAQQTFTTLQSAPTKDLLDGQVGVEVSAEDEELLEADGEVPPETGVSPLVLGVHLSVEASQENGSQQWPVALQSASRIFGFSGGQMLLGQEEVELEAAAALVMELVQLDSVALPIGKADALVRSVLVGQAQLMIVKTSVVFTIITSAIEAEKRLRVHPISIGIECILLFRTRCLVLEIILIGGKDWKAV